MKSTWDNDLECGKKSMQVSFSSPRFSHLNFNSSWVRNRGGLGPVRPWHAFRNVLQFWSKIIVIITLLSVSVLKCFTYFFMFTYLVRKICQSWHHGLVPGHAVSAITENVFRRVKRSEKNAISIFLRSCVDSIKQMKKKKVSDICTSKCTEYLSHSKDISLLFSIKMWYT